MSTNYELMPQARRIPEEVVTLRRDITQRPSDVEQSGWVHTVTVLNRHWRWATAFVAVVLITAAVALVLIKPLYQPTARIEVDPPGAETFSLQAGAAGFDPADYLETQAQKLRSDEIALAVIGKFHLEENPEFVGKGKATSKSQQANRDDPSSSDLLLENRILKQFSTNLKVTRDSASRLITVGFAAHDPKLAAQITNTVVDQFIDTSYKTRHASIVKSAGWLTEQLNDIRTKMENSNRALADYQEATGIATIDENESTFSEKMKELNQQLVQAQADRIQYEAFVRSLRDAADSEAPQITSDPVIQELTKKVAEARGQLSQALVVYGSNDPHAKELQNLAEELQKQLVHQRNTIIGNLRTSYSAALTREHLQQSQIHDVSEELSQVSQYIALKKEAQANVELYNRLYTMVKEALISAESKSTSIRVVDRARILSYPTWPNRALSMLAAMVAGLMGGIALAFLRDGIDRTVRTLHDVRMCTGLSAVSLVPQIGAAGGLLQRRGSLKPPQKLFLDRPHSPESEALFALRTSLRLCRSKQPPQMLLIASPFPGEGKTTIAVNLAVALAHRWRTCLVDADIRKSGNQGHRASVASSFGLTPAMGLSDVLTGSLPIEKALVSIPTAPHFFVLPAGRSSNHPIDLLSSAAVHNVLRDLRERFEVIIIDSPPILPFADARILAGLVDGIVLVGRAGCTSRDALTRSIELMDEARSAPVLEVVLNAAGRDVSRDSSYYYFH